MKAKKCHAFLCAYFSNQAHFNNLLTTTVVPDTNLGYEIMIALAKQDGSSVVVYDENGNTMFYRLGELVGFTSTTVSIKSGSYITVYDEHGNTKFVR